MLRELRAAFAEALDGVVEQPSAYQLANPTPPSSDVTPTPVDYDKAFQGGQDLWTLTVRVLVDATDDIGAQMALDDYLEPIGPKSLKEQLEEHDWPEFVDSVRVIRAVNYKPYKRDDGGLLLGCDWIVEVRASRG